MQVFELKHQLSIYLVSVLITGLYRPLEGLTYLKCKLLCFLTPNKIIFKGKVLAFNLDRCCHLALCLQLILFHSTKEGCSHCCNCKARQATKNLDKQVCEQISVFNDWHNGGRNGRQGEQKQNKKVDLILRRFSGYLGRLCCRHRPHNTRHNDNQHNDT
jgi:hypothetical protein